MSRYQDGTGRCDGAGGDETMRSGGEARPAMPGRVPVVAVRDELRPAITAAAACAGAVTLRVSVMELAARWASAAVIVFDEAAAAELAGLHDIERLRRQVEGPDSAPAGPLGPGMRAGRPTVLLYTGRPADWSPAQVGALWEAADVLDVTCVLPHGDWLDDPVREGWSHLLGAILALGATPPGPGEHELGARR